MEPGNPVTHFVFIERLPFSTFRRILETLRVEFNYCNIFLVFFAIQVIRGKATGTASDRMRDDCGF